MRKQSLKSSSSSAASGACGCWFRESVNLFLASPWEILSVKEERSLGLPLPPCQPVEWSSSPLSSSLQTVGCNDLWQDSTKPFCSLLFSIERNMMLFHCLLTYSKLMVKLESDVTSLMVVHAWSYSWYLCCSYLSRSKAKLWFDGTKTIFLLVSIPSISSFTTSSTSKILPSLKCKESIHIRATVVI